MGVFLHMIMLLVVLYLKLKPQNKSEDIKELLFTCVVDTLTPKIYSSPKSHSEHGNGNLLLIQICWLYL